MQIVIALPLNWIYVQSSIMMMNSLQANCFIKDQYYQIFAFNTVLTFQRYAFAYRQTNKNHKYMTHFRFYP